MAAKSLLMKYLIALFNRRSPCPVKNYSAEVDRLLALDPDQVICYTL